MSEKLLLRDASSYRGDFILRVCEALHGQTSSDGSADSIVQCVDEALLRFREEYGPEWLSTRALPHHDTAMRALVVKATKGVTCTDASKEAAMKALLQKHVPPSQRGSQSNDGTGDGSRNNAAVVGSNPGDANTFGPKMDDPVGGDGRHVPSTGLNNDPLPSETGDVAAKKSKPRRKRRGKGGNGESGVALTEETTRDVSYVDRENKSMDTVDSGEKTTRGTRGPKRMPGALKGFPGGGAFLSSEERRRQREAMLDQFESEVRSADSARRENRQRNFRETQEDEGSYVEGELDRLRTRDDFRIPKDKETVNWNADRENKGVKRTGNGGLKSGVHVEGGKLFGPPMPREGTESGNKPPPEDSPDDVDFWGSVETPTTARGADVARDPAAKVRALNRKPAGSNLPSAEDFPALGGSGAAGAAGVAGGPGVGISGVAGSRGASIEYGASSASGGSLPAAEDFPSLGGSGGMAASRGTGVYTAKGFLAAVKTKPRYTTPSVVSQPPGPPSSARPTPTASTPHRTPANTEEDFPSLSAAVPLSKGSGSAGPKRVPATAAVGGASQPGSGKATSAAPEHGAGGANPVAWGLGSTGAALKQGSSGGSDTGVDTSVGIVAGGGTSSYWSAVSAPAPSLPAPTTAAVGAGDQRARAYGKGQEAKAVPQLASEGDFPSLSPAAQPASLRWRPKDVSPNTASKPAAPQLASPSDFPSLAAASVPATQLSASKQGESSRKQPDRTNKNVPCGVSPADLIVASARDAHHTVENYWSMPIGATSEETKEDVGGVEEAVERLDVGGIDGLESRRTCDGLESRRTCDGLESRRTCDGLESRRTCDGLESRRTCDGLEGPACDDPEVGSEYPNANGDCEPEPSASWQCYEDESRTRVGISFASIARAHALPDAPPPLLTEADDENMKMAEAIAAGLRTTLCDDDSNSNKNADAVSDAGSRTEGSPDLSPCASSPASTTTSPRLRKKKRAKSRKTKTPSPPIVEKGFVLAEPSILPCGRLGHSDGPSAVSSPPLASDWRAAWTEERAKRITAGSTPYQRSILEGYVLLKVLGKGSFGLVLQVGDVASGDVYALKVVPVEKMSEKDRSYVLRERKVLRWLHVRGMGLLPRRQSLCEETNKSVEGGDEGNTIDTNGLESQADVISESATPGGNEDDVSNVQCEENLNPQKDQDTEVTGATGDVAETTLTSEPHVDEVDMIRGCPFVCGFRKAVHGTIKLSQLLSATSLPPTPDASEFVECVGFFFDLVDGIGLFEFLRNQAMFAEEVVRFYASEIAVAVGWLHDNDVLHRDLKPENVLLDRDGHIRLIDFNLARKGVTRCARSESMCGTCEYMAPELVKREGHGVGCDWWSFGVLVYELLVGESPFATPSNNNKTVMDKICSGKIKFPKFLTGEAVSLISSLLSVDPTKRLGCQGGGLREIQAHPFFAKTRWTEVERGSLDPPLIPESHLCWGGINKETPTALSRFLRHQGGAVIHRGRQFDGFECQGEGSLHVRSGKAQDDLCDTLSTSSVEPILEGSHQPHFSQEAHEDEWLSAEET